MCGSSGSKVALMDLVALNVPSTFRTFHKRRAVTRTPEILVKAERREAGAEDEASSEEQINEGRMRREGEER